MTYENTTKFPVREFEDLSITDKQHTIFGTIYTHDNAFPTFRLRDSVVEHFDEMFNSFSPNAVVDFLNNLRVEKTQKTFQPLDVAAGSDYAAADSMFVVRNTGNNLQVKRVRAEKVIREMRMQGDAFTVDGDVSYPSKNIKSLSYRIDENGKDTLRLQGPKNTVVNIIYDRHKNTFLVDHKNGGRKVFKPLSDHEILVRPFDNSSMIVSRDFTKKQETHLINHPKSSITSSSFPLTESAMKKEMPESCYIHNNGDAVTVLNIAVQKDVVDLKTGQPIQSEMTLKNGKNLFVKASKNGRYAAPAVKSAKKTAEKTERPSTFKLTPEAIQELVLGMKTSDFALFKSENLIASAPGTVKTLRSSVYSGNNDDMFWEIYVDPKSMKTRKQKLNARLTFDKTSLIIPKLGGVKKMVVRFPKESLNEGKYESVQFYYFMNNNLEIHREKVNFETGVDIQNVFDRTDDKDFCHAFNEQIAAAFLQNKHISEMSVYDMSRKQGTGTHFFDTGIEQTQYSQYGLINRGFDIQDFSLKKVIEVNTFGEVVHHSEYNGQNEPTILKGSPITSDQKKMGPKTHNAALKKLLSIGHPVPLHPSVVPAAAILEKVKEI